MADYLDLNRYFMPFQDEPSWEVSYNTFLGREPLGAENWSAILKRRRTVVLAEAGSGKTAEFRECAKRLRDVGSTAFYLTVNSLSKRGLREALLSREDVESYDAWLKDEAEAVFLVDSVDEARLFGESLEDALSTLQKGLGDQSARATILISSRVSDWRSKEDKALVSTYLGPPANESKPDDPIVEMDDAVFLDRLFRRDRSDESRDEETPKPDNYDPYIVALAPLTIQQAKDLAAQEGVVDCDELVKAIQDADAESLANRPQDLLGLIANWKKDQTVGTKYQILKWSLKQRLREPNLDLRRRDTLSEETAVRGARAVAAAMSLGHKRFIAWPLDGPSGPQDAVSLNPEDALPDWSGHDQQFLLNRAIFDPASHGRVRFHHSSAQELLTAEWMLEQIKAGCPVRRIWNLLSKEQYGTRRLRPSLRPVTAWLAQLDNRFRQLVLPLEPDLIIEGGDPELLPINDRKIILRQFAERYRGRDDAGIRVDINQISRLAHQDLDETIRELWLSAGSSGEVREFLLRLIWVGQIETCADIALQAATSRRSAYEQALGARAMQSIGTPDQKQALATHIRKYAKTYPKRALAPALIGIYPAVISLEDLEALIRKRPADNMKSLHAGLSYGLIEIAEHADLPDPIGLARLFYKLSREKPWVEEAYQEHSIRFAHLAAPLSTLCTRLVQSCPSSRDLEPDVAEATRYVGIISDHSSDFRTSEARTELDKAIQGKPLINRQMFWLAVEAERQNNGDLHSHHAANGLGELWWLSESDMDWLLTDLRTQDNLNDRLVALTGAFAIWRHIGEPAAGLERINAAIGRNNDLNEALSKLISPPESEKTDFQIRHERMMEQRHKEKAEKEARIGESWQQFRDRIAANPEPLRDISDINELYDLAVWLALGHRRDSYTLTDWRSLEVPITVAVAKAARDGLVKFGRAFDPKLSAIRANRTPNLVKIALPGLAIDALETPDWASTLSSAEVARASKTALLELNGFPDWAPTLWTARNDIAEKVLKPEIRWEFNQASKAGGVHHIVSRLSYTSEPFRTRASNWVLDELEKREPKDDRVLNAALETVTKSKADFHARLKALAPQRFASSRKIERKLFWMSIWLAVDADAALDAFELWLAKRPSIKDRDLRVQRLLNIVFDHGSYRRGMNCCDFARFEPLKRFVRLAYAHVRREDDIVREGVYSSDDRDNAESARSTLLGMLIDTGGEHVFGELKCMSAEPIFAVLQERLLVLAERRARADADLEPWTPQQMYAFASRAEKPPATLSDLHEIIGDRLWDIEDTAKAGRFIDKKDLRQDDVQRADERKIQLFLADQLYTRSAGAYSVEREPELPTLDEPDIQVQRAGILGVLPIEIKVADSWSYAQLVETVRDQLIGKYMRSKHETHGYLVLTYHGKKGHWHKGKGHPRINTFPDLVKALQDEADAIAAECDHVETVSVSGIDLTE